MKQIAEKGTNLENLSYTQDSTLSILVFHLITKSSPTPEENVGMRRLLKLKHKMEKVIQFILVQYQP